MHWLGNAGKDMKPPNYIEKVQNKEAEGFNVRRRTNRIQPKKDSEPLTVVEFSLIDTYRDKLKAALDAKPYEEWKAEELKGVIEGHLPGQILKELMEFGPKKGAKTVYVMHNLPEMSDARAIAAAKLGSMEMACYSTLIQKGIAASLELKPSLPFVIKRKDKDTGAEGDNLHKHQTTIDMLGAVVSNDAATRFTDFKSALEASTKYFSGLRREELHVVNTVNNDFKSSYPRVSEYEAQHSDWKAEELRISPPKREKQWEAMLKAHSQEVVLKKGSLAIWANDGHLYHQAMHQHQPLSANKEYTRIGVGMGCER